MSWRLLGDLQAAEILLIVDHASAALPEGVDLGVPREWMEQHIAFDIGVGTIAELLAKQSGSAAVCAQWSRLLVDLNRAPDDTGVIPDASDGVSIPGNVLGGAAREARLQTYHAPYHAELERLIDKADPCWLLFLHSFTPCLSTSGEPRPWDVGLLYNEDRRATDIAMRFFEKQGLVVGDQQPYTGLIYNYSFMRHAEARGLPYLLLEIRQDHIDTEEGQARFAELIRQLSDEMAEGLA